MIDMGWLFGKKKVPKVPLPPGRDVHEQALQFPRKGSSIEDQIKVAAGVDAEPSTTQAPLEGGDVARSVDDGPVYVKVDVYQRLLGELSSFKKEFANLNQISKKLEQSEYNEENHFNKIKKNIKTLHDRLLQMDKKIFQMGNN